MNELGLRRLRFRVGSKPDQPPLQVDCPHVTVLVGPNNAGKSQTLREIEEFCCSLQPPSTVLEAVNVQIPNNSTTIIEMMEVFRSKTRLDDPADAEYIRCKRPRISGSDREQQTQIRERDFESWIEHQDHRSIHTQFVAFFTRRLDGRTRFELVDPKPSGDIKELAENLLWYLFVADEERKLIRNFTKEAFGKHFVIDATGMQTLRIRLSDEDPEDHIDEKCMGPETSQFMFEANDIQSLGDGVQTSVGLISAVLSLPDRIILVDEPEAFLHPTLARRVGRALAETARSRQASLVIATHSSELLLGCMHATPDLRIVRLSYESGVGSARSLEPEELTRLMHDPLLRSAHSLRALFHRGAVVCESDTDRAFYEEVNSRLIADSRGLEDCLFMNAQNWQTIPRVVEPLRRIGVPALAIFDLDVMMHKDFWKIWPLVDLDGAALHRLQENRAALSSQMKAVEKKALKQQGLITLGSKEAVAARAVLNEFAEFGVLFVPVGELESWLSDLVSPKPSKQDWLLRMFEAMGADPSAKNYVRPDKGDVWSFIETARDWIGDPSRKGMPA
jgi:ABC-type cobalamin/Fe3+-siderophores transport system ATPase subunit